MVTGRLCQKGQEWRNSERVLALWENESNTRVSVLGSMANESMEVIRYKKDSIPTISSLND